MAGDCHNLLTLLKRVSRSRRINQRYGKDHNTSERSTDLPFSSSAEAIIASQQGYFPDSNRFGSICFYIFKGDDYTLTFPINSPSGAQGREIASHQIEEDHQLIIGEIGVFSKIGLLHQRTVQSLIQRPFKRNTSLLRVAIP